MDDKSFESIKKRIEDFRFEETFDTIVAVANGGIIPAAMLNQRLNLEIQLLKLHFRDPRQQPEYPQPVLVEPLRFEVKGKSVLLVEDRVKTGASLEMAKRLLLDAGAGSVKTFAVNGNADYYLYNESCFRFPWILNIF
jgi:uncharacterized protein